MEHLLLPHSATITKAERAPFVAILYDGGPFLSYPERSPFKQVYEKAMPEGGWRGYDVSFDEAERQDVAVFLQTWAFFGLLYEVFGDDAPAEDFISREENEGTFITTATLGDVCNDWVDRRCSKGDAGKDLQKHHVQCLKMAMDFVHAIYDDFAVSGMNPAILRSIVCLGETLEKVVLGTFQGFRGTGVRWTSYYNVDELAEKMGSNGWCPADVRVWRRNMSSFTLLHYLSKLEQPRTKQHNQCVGPTCVANRYDDTDRPSKHRCVGRDCSDLFVDDENVISALATGHIALLDIPAHGDNIDCTTVDVVSSEHNAIYVAISHVWTDGLGNPNANALPRCQIAYVGKIVKLLAQATGHHKLLLWLDTLCCPAKSPEHRNMCIMRMRQIYTQATHVLVLDADLAQHLSKDTDSVEVLARLVFSGWTRRLW